jgi:hypothetical protein
MNTTTQADLTIDNFAERTGFRFRISREQKDRIAAGTLTRRDAFSEFMASGGVDRLQKSRRPDVPLQVYLDPELTVDNFSEKVKALTGIARRFRVSREQRLRIKAGTLTREQALAEIISSVPKV